MLRPAALRHNLNYWRFGDFIGIGAGAHGKLTFADGRILRTWKTRLPKDYLNWPNRTKPVRSCCQSTSCRSSS